MPISGRGRAGAAGRRRGYRHRALGPGDAGAHPRVAEMDGNANRGPVRGGFRSRLLAAALGDADGEGIAYEGFIGAL